MKTQTIVDINDKVPMTFTSMLAAMIGNDGTEGSISMLVAPIDTSVEGNPPIMGIRGSQHIVFEHEGRRGLLDLAAVYEKWVEELGDEPPNEDDILDEQTMEDRRIKAKKRWEDDGEPSITMSNAHLYRDMFPVNDEEETPA